MALIEGRIPQFAFKIVIGVTIGLSIIAAVARIAIRFKSQRRLHLDDYLLIFACICLIAATVLLYLGLSAIYFIEELSLNGIKVLTAGNISMKDFLDQLIFYQRIYWAYLSLTWATIFCVKFAFLAFFRNFVDRLPPMQRYWKLVTVLTGLIFAFEVCGGFIACPKLGLAAPVECSQPGALSKSLAIGVIVTTLDIITDVLILSIPVSLLWRVRIKPHQKLGLGIFLCLSVVMIITAITRVSGLHYYGTFDTSWIYLWQQIESCAAVTMISLTAFCSVFVANASAGMQVSPWQDSMPWVLRKHRKLGSEDRDLADLTIPSATLTGMRAFIDGNQGNETVISHDEVQEAQHGHKYRGLHESTAV